MPSSMLVSTATGDRPRQSCAMSSFRLVSTATGDRTRHVRCHPPCWWVLELETEQDLYDAILHAGEYCNWRQTKTRTMPSSILVSTATGDRPRQSCAMSSFILVNIATGDRPRHVRCTWSILVSTATGDRTRHVQCHPPCWWVLQRETDQDSQVLCHPSYWWVLQLETEQDLYDAMIHLGEYCNWRQNKTCTMPSSMLVSTATGDRTRQSCAMSSFILVSTATGDRTRSVRYHDPCWWVLQLETEQDMYDAILFIG